MVEIIVEIVEIEINVGTIEITLTKRIPYYFSVKLDAGMIWASCLIDEVIATPLIFSLDNGALEIGCVIGNAFLTSTNLVEVFLELDFTKALLGE